jgi:D-amino-acid dehydrogenase
MTKIAIIGAGITGVTTAYSLIKRGYRVTVFDRNRYPGMETSFANGGQLSVSNAEVWNHWSTVVKGLRWMLRSDAPLLMNPRPNWHKYSWLAEFAANIPRYRANTIETVRLALLARQRLVEIAEAEAIDFDHVKRGILHIYRDRSSFERAGQVNELLQQGGLARRSVTPLEINEIEPAIRGTYYGGYYTEADSTGDIHKFTRALAMASQRLGVDFVSGAEVADLSLGTRSVTVELAKSDSRPGAYKEHFDGIVICAGIESKRLAKLAGDRVNIYPVKGYSITVNLQSDVSQAAAPWVSLLDDDAKIVTSRLGLTRFRVAGTAELNGANRDIRADRIRPLVDWTRTLFPNVETDSVTPWAGLRPMMPSMLPRVGSGRHPSVFYNTGHGHLGWTLSAATAEVVAAKVEQSMPADTLSYAKAA